jgi:hypothetical protein
LLKGVLMSEIRPWFKQMRRFRVRSTAPASDGAGAEELAANLRLLASVIEERFDLPDGLQAELQQRTAAHLCLVMDVLASRVDVNHPAVRDQLNQAQEFATEITDALATNG